MNCLQRLRLLSGREGRPPLPVVLNAAKFISDLSRGM